MTTMVVTMVVMVMVVVMIMVVVVVCIELFRRDGLLRHLRKLQDVVHRLVLEDRRPEFGEELRIAAIIVVDLALLTRELPDALEQGAAHLLVGDLDLLARADL